MSYVDRLCAQTCLAFICGVYGGVGGVNGDGCWERCIGGGGGCGGGGRAGSIGYI